MSALSGNPIERFSCNQAHLIQVVRKLLLSYHANNESTDHHAHLQSDQRLNSKVSVVSYSNFL